MFIVLDFLLLVDDVDDDDVFLLDVVDDFGWVLLLVGLVVDLFGFFVGLGRDFFVFFKMGIILDFEVGWKL